jgi:hypothetical protein
MQYGLEVAMNRKTLSSCFEAYGWVAVVELWREFMVCYTSSHKFPYRCSMLNSVLVSTPTHLNGIIQKQRNVFLVLVSLAEI